MDALAFETHKFESHYTEILQRSQGQRDCLQHTFRSRESNTVQMGGEFEETEFYFYSQVFGFKPADPIEPVHIDHIEHYKAAERLVETAQPAA